MCAVPNPHAVTNCLLPLRLSTVPFSPSPPIILILLVFFIVKPPKWRVWLQKGVLLVSGNKSVQTICGRTGHIYSPMGSLQLGNGQGLPALQTKQDVGRLKWLTYTCASSWDQIWENLFTLAVALVLIVLKICQTSCPLTNKHINVNI